MEQIIQIGLALLFAGIGSLILVVFFILKGKFWSKKFDDFVVVERAIANPHDRPLIYGDGLGTMKFHGVVTAYKRFRNTICFSVEDSKGRKFDIVDLKYNSENEELGDIIIKNKEDVACGEKPILAIKKGVNGMPSINDKWEHQSIPNAIKEFSEITMSKVREEVKEQTDKILEWNNNRKQPAPDVRNPSDYRQGGMNG